MIVHISLFLLGLVILMVGAECLIRGSVRIARALGVSPFIIGFTLVGFGTSAPELVVSVSAALHGSPAIALGNVVGSNIANIGLILAIAAIIRPLDGEMRLLKIEVPLVIVLSLLLWFLCRDGTLSRIDGMIFLTLFVAVMLYMYRSARKEPPEVKEEVGKTAAVKMRLWQAAILVGIGLGGLVWGANLMVESAVAMAREFGVSEWLIGLTIVAVGTSLPELAATGAAAWKGESDIALGNILGSNVFNILLILGVTVVVNPMRVNDSVLFREMPAMVLFAGLLLPILLNGLKVYRWEGCLLLAVYVLFVGWQVSTAK